MKPENLERATKIKKELDTLRAILQGTIDVSIKVRVNDNSGKGYPYSDLYLSHYDAGRSTRKDHRLLCYSEKEEKHFRDMIENDLRERLKIRIKMLINEIEEL